MMRVGEGARPENKHGTELHLAPLASLAIGAEMLRKRLLELEGNALPHHANTVDRIDEGFSVLGSEVPWCTHKHGKVKVWLAVCPRFHVDYTPTDASWINQVERWFGLITQQAIRRGSFPEVKELISKNNSFVEHYNVKTSPFARVATAESSPVKIPRLCKRISGKALSPKTLTPLLQQGF